MKMPIGIPAGEFRPLAKKELRAEVKEILDKIDELFVSKNEQYRTNADDLANFTMGAHLLGREADELGRFTALKSYVAKHIAKVYDGELNDSKMDESIMDIAVYFILAAVMHKRMKESEARAKQ